MSRPQIGRLFLFLMLTPMVSVGSVGCSGLPSSQQTPTAFGAPDSDDPLRDTTARGDRSPVVGRTPGAPPVSNMPRGASSDSGSRFANASAPVGGLVVETPPIQRSGG